VRRRRKLRHKGWHIFHLGNKKASFRYAQAFHRHTGADVELAPKGGARNLRVGPSVACEVFKTLGRYEEADFFMHLSHHALKKGLVAFAMTAKQADLAGEKDPRNVVSLLQQKASTLVKEECGSHFSDAAVPSSQPSLRKAHHPEGVFETPNHRSILISPNKMTLNQGARLTAVAMLIFAFASVGSCSQVGSRPRPAGGQGDPLAQQCLHKGAEKDLQVRRVHAPHRRAENQGGKLEGIIFRRGPTAWRVTDTARHRGRPCVRRDC
jgi:hypothetical protein